MYPKIGKDHVAEEFLKVRSRILKMQHKLKGIDGKDKKKGVYDHLYSRLEKERQKGVWRCLDRDRNI